MENFAMNKLSKLNLNLLNIVALLAVASCGNEPDKQANSSEKSKKNDITGKYICSLDALKSIELRGSGKAYYTTDIFGNISENVGNYEIDTDKLIINRGDGEAILFSVKENILAVNQAGLKGECKKELTNEERQTLSKESKVIGKWMPKKYSSLLSLNLRKDGTFITEGVYGDEKGTWILNSDTSLIVTSEGSTETTKMEFSFVTNDEVVFKDTGKKGEVDTFLRIDPRFENENSIVQRLYTDKEFHWALVDSQFPPSKLETIGMPSLAVKFLDDCRKEAISAIQGSNSGDKRREKILECLAKNIKENI